jgi:electron transfer flavoprotein alpha subunit
VNVLVYLETSGGVVTEGSLQSLALARSLSDDSSVAGVVACDALAEELPTTLGAHGVAALFVAEDPLFGSHAPLAIARAVATLVPGGSDVLVGPGSDTGNEVLAHAAAILDVPFAANCVAVTPGAELVVTRTRWGGSLLEEARLHGSPVILSVQPHAVQASESEAVSRPAAVCPVDFESSEADRAVRVVDRVEAPEGGISLAEAKVVVSGGRGVGSAEGFAIVEELAGLLGAAVGCSRVVTSAGWRPHTDQVGQTGTKISPDLYVPCGISGATQHIAGCRGAKKILAINADPEAPIFASADYAVIGDLHEVLPAISAEIRKARES